MAKKKKDQDPMQLSIEDQLEALDLAREAVTDPTVAPVIEKAIRLLEDIDNESRRLEETRQQIYADQKARREEEDGRR